MRWLSRFPILGPPPRRRPRKPRYFAEASPETKQAWSKLLASELKEQRVIYAWKPTRTRFVDTKDRDYGEIVVSTYKGKREEEEKHGGSTT